MSAGSPPDKELRRIVRRDIRQRLFDAPDEHLRSADNPFAIPIGGSRGDDRPCFEMRTHDTW
jgi:hypothetical protein